MSENMVERVAREMFTQHRAEVLKPYDVAAFNQNGAPYLRMARAAIESMRWPSGQMQDAGKGVLTGATYGDRGLALDTWTAMIDTALSQTPSITESRG